MQKCRKQSRKYEYLKGTLVMTSSKEFDLFIKMLLKMLKKGDVQEVIELLEESINSKDKE